VFVYGTLRRATASAAHRQLAQRATFVAEAVLQGRLYDLGSYPGAVSSTDPGERVHGEVYRLEDPTATLAWLDEYEGLAPGADAGEYARRLVDVRLSSGATVAAWAYLYRGPTRGRARIVSGDFVGARWS